MPLEQDIVELIRSTANQRNPVQERDIEIILKYYGFDNSRFYSHEELAQIYSISNPRIGEIINLRFLSKVIGSEVQKTLTEIGKVIAEKKFWFPPDISDELLKRNLVESLPNIYRLIGMLNLFTPYNDYELFTPNFDKATKDYVEGDELLLLSHKPLAEKLKKPFMQINHAQSKTGIANLSSLLTRNGSILSLIDFSSILQYLEHSKNCCVFVDDRGNYWYSFESRSLNIITNRIRKIKNIADNIKTDILAERLSDSLRANVAKSRIPEKEIIHKYLTLSKLIPYKDDYSYFGHISAKLPLDPLELDLLDLFSKHGREYFTYPELFSLLTGRGYSIYNILSICSFSVLLYADRSAGRWHYKYYLISSFAK